MMKTVFSLLVVGLVFTSFGQDSTKTTVKVKKIEQKKVFSTPANSMPTVKFRKVSADELNAENITGDYIIERYNVQVKTSDTKEAIDVVGTALIVDLTSISGTEMDSIQFQLSDSEFMNTEDYLYRIFGVVPETTPEDLPLTLVVHKTNNLECYGIGELPDGTILIPYKGLLLYLRPKHQ